MHRTIGSQQDMNRLGIAQTGGVFLPETGRDASSGTGIPARPLKVAATDPAMAVKL